jgi:hypothetical protein
MRFHYHCHRRAMLTVATTPRVIASSSGMTPRNVEGEQLYRYKLHLRFCNMLTSEHAGAFISLLRTCLFLPLSVLAHSLPWGDNPLAIGNQHSIRLARR